LRLLLSVPAGGGGAASSVAGGQDPVLRHVTGGWYQVTVSLLPPLQPSPISGIKWRLRVTGRECPLISYVMRPVLTAAESAVMHIISADTIELDTILSIPILSIRYTQYQFQYNTDPIIVRL